MDSPCYICKRAGADTTGSYGDVTGRRTPPGLNSRNFDDRYGFPVHYTCLARRRARRKARRR